MALTDIVLTEEDLPAVQMVLNRPEFEELAVLFLGVRAALKAGLEYPVRDADQLENFLREIGHDVAWFEERFAAFLPVQDENDFIVKARLATQQLLTLEPNSITWPKQSRK